MEDYGMFIIILLIIVKEEEYRLFFMHLMWNVLFDDQKSDVWQCRKLTVFVAT